MKDRSKASDVYLSTLELQIILAALAPLIEEPRCIDVSNPHLKQFVYKRMKRTYDKLYRKYKKNGGFDERKDLEP